MVELTGLSGEGDLENKLPLEAGRFFTKEEAETGVPVLVVLDTYAKIMWGEEKPEKLLRKQVLLEIGGEKKPFQIIGIFDTGVDLRKDLGAGTKPGIYMSLKTYDKLLGMSPEKSCYALNLKEEVETAEGYKAIEEVLCRYGEKNDYTLLPYCGKVVSLKLNP